MSDDLTTVVHRAFRQWALSESETLDELPPIIAAMVRAWLTEDAQIQLSNEAYWESPTGTNGDRMRAALGALVGETS